MYFEIGSRVWSGLIRIVVGLPSAERTVQQQMIAEQTMCVTILIAKVPLPWMVPQRTAIARPRKDIAATSAILRCVRDAADRNHHTSTGDGPGLPAPQESRAPAELRADVRAGARVLSAGGR